MNNNNLTDIEPSLPPHDGYQAVAQLIHMKRLTDTYDLLYKLSAAADPQSSSHSSPKKDASGKKR